MILLTFDDGPIPETTPLILKTLSDHNIKAAFFCVGENISRHPDLYRMIINGGHLVCNHTFNHKVIPKLSRVELADQISKFNNATNEGADSNILYFRPPYGKFNLSALSLLKQMKLKIVMWSLLTYDYTNNFDVVKFAVRKYLKENSLIVLHDSLKSKDIIVESIKFIAEESSLRGYKFGVPAECLR